MASTKRKTAAVWTAELQRLETEANKLIQAVEGGSNAGQMSIHAQLYRHLWERDEEHHHFYPEDESAAYMWGEDFLRVAPEAADLYGEDTATEFMRWLEENRDVPVGDLIELTTKDSSAPALVLPELLAAATPASEHVGALFRDLEGRLQCVDALQQTYETARDEAKRFIEEEIAPVIAKSVKEHHEKRALKKARK